MYYISNNITCVGKMLKSSHNKNGSAKQFVTYNINLYRVFLIKLYR